MQTVTVPARACTHSLQLNITQMQLQICDPVTIPRLFTKGPQLIIKLDMQVGKHRGQNAEFRQDIPAGQHG